MSENDHGGKINTNNSKILGMNKTFFTLGFILMACLLYSVVYGVIFQAELVDENEMKKVIDKPIVYTLKETQMDVKEVNEESPIIINKGMLTMEREKVVDVKLESKDIEKKENLKKVNLKETTLINNNNMDIQIKNHEIIKRQSEEDDIHIVFSTSCDPYQDWQSIVQIWSAIQVNQPGRITRLVSGCTQQQENRLKEIYEKLGPEFNLHFTPAYEIKDAKGKPYVYFNKCNAITHWLENAKPKESVIVLNDPDFMFLDKLTPFIKNMTNLVYDKKAKNANVPEKIVPGRPVAQGYAMGTRWLNWDKEFICGKGSPCTRTTPKQASDFYQVGPPYILHREDWEKLAPLWVEYTKRIVPYHTEFLAEMFSYSMAAAHLELKHARLSNFMISNSVVGGENWEPIDQAVDFCRKPVDDPNIYLPTYFHFCQPYRLGEWVFYKSRVPKDILSCNSPLLREPPQDLADDGINKNLEFEMNIQHKKQGGHQVSASKMPMKLRRNAFALCTVYRELNKAFTWYKTKMCPGEINLEKTIKFRRPPNV